MLSPLFHSDVLIFEFVVYTTKIVIGIVPTWLSRRPHVGKEPFHERPTSIAHEESLGDENGMIKFFAKKSSGLTNSENYPSSTGLLNAPCLKNPINLRADSLSSPLVGSSQFPRLGPGFQGDRQSSLLTSRKSLEEQISNNGVGLFGETQLLQEFVNPCFQLF